MLSLYYRPGTCALASYLALAEAGADFNAIDLTDRPELLAAVNPRGKVPVLEVDGLLLCENVAILGHVAECHPRSQLLPSEAFERAQCMATVSWFASTLHIDYRRFLKPQVFSPDPAAHAAISAEGAQQYRSGLAELEQQLRGREWLHGGGRSVADLYGQVFVDWAVRSSLADPAWRAIPAWVARLRSRPAVSAVLNTMGSPLLTWG